MKQSQDTKKHGIQDNLNLFLRCPDCGGNPHVGASDYQHRPHYLTAWVTCSDCNNSRTVEIRLV